jgi:hydrogenase maturation protease
MLHVLCFGNPWQGDDGFGTHVFRRLRELGDLPGHVEVFDAGIAGLGAIGYFEGCRKAVIVDALKTGGRVGRVRRLRAADLVPPGRELSLHGFGVAHLLTALPIVFEGRSMPEVVIIGAEIGDVRRFTDELTPPLPAAIDKAARLVWREMNMASVLGSVAKGARRGLTAVNGPNGEGSPTDRVHGARVTRRATWPCGR